MDFLAKTRFLVIVIVIQAVLLISILATIGYRYYSFRQVRNEPLNNMGNRPPQPGDFISRSLQLTPEQRDDFSMLRDNFHRTFDSLDAQMQVISKQITDEVVEEKPNKAVIDSLIDRFGDIQKLQKKAMVEHFIEMKSFCTPEQCERFNKMIIRMDEYQQRSHRNAERMRRGSERGPRNR